MSTFPETDDEWWVYYFLKKGGVVKYWQPTIIEQDCQRLEYMGYRLDSFNCLEWVDEDTMHKQLKTQLAFPDYYGQNLHALNDCIRSNIEISENKGRVLVFNRYDAVATLDRDLAWQVLDIMASATYIHLLRNRRFFVFIQSDDPQISFNKVGLHHIAWNHREWLNKDRGL